MNITRKELKLQLSGLTRHELIEALIEDEMLIEKLQSKGGK